MPKNPETLQDIIALMRDAIAEHEASAERDDHAIAELRAALEICEDVASKLPNRAT